MRNHSLDLSACFPVREVQDRIPEVDQASCRRMQTSRVSMPRWQVGSQFLARHHSFSFFDSVEAISRRLR
jgi:hypothetical protein